MFELLSTDTWLYAGFDITTGGGGLATNYVTSLSLTKPKMASRPSN